jgi:hypothetical protein
VCDVFVIQFLPQWSIERDCDNWMLSGLDGSAVKYFYANPNDTALSVMLPGQTDWNGVLVKRG